MARSWVAVASQDHVRKAVEGGFVQVNHGKEAPLRRIARGDQILFYSPRQEMRTGSPIQAFTAIGKAVDDVPYRATQSETFQPFRRRVRYARAKDAPIHPMLEQLSFSRDRGSWGQILQRGFFEIEANDYAVIASAMEVS